jgi:DNA-binding GntR family transcriptional regulator
MAGSVDGQARIQATPQAGAQRVSPIRRQTITTLTLEALRERILRGDYPEGSPLRQDALAADLGVSRIPVREALRQLEAEGLVTLSPHHGATVSTLSIGEVRELFEIRALIETDLLRRAIPHLSPADLDRADEILERYETAFRAGDVATWGELNWQFHAVLLTPAGRPLSMGLVESLQNQSDRYIRLQLSLSSAQSRANYEHHSIVDAIREGDTDRACALLSAHINDAGLSLLDFLREHRAEAEQ